MLYQPSHPAKDGSSLCYQMYNALTDDDARVRAARID